MDLHEILERIVRDGEPVEDKVAPVVTEAKYVLNVLNKDLLADGYVIKVPAKIDNAISGLVITIKEDSVIKVTGTTDTSIKVNQILIDNKLAEITPNNGVANLDLTEITKDLNKIDFSKYAVGATRYIELTLTDSNNNVEVIKVIIEVVAQ